MANEKKRFIGGNVNISTQSTLILIFFFKSWLPFNNRLEEFSTMEFINNLPSEVC